MKLETVKIKHGDGFAVINADEFDPKKHEKWSAAKPKPKTTFKKRRITDGD